MDQFSDRNGCSVRLAFQQNAFAKTSEHVIVICRYDNKWLLTSHKKRGWEFPGGKIEAGETPEQAALREVSEETGGMLETFFAIGEYEVSNGLNSFVKTIFYGSVGGLFEKNDYMETNGPVFEEGDILEARFGEKYSFIMKDDVIKNSLEKLAQLNFKVPVSSLELKTTRLLTSS